MAKSRTVRDKKAGKSPDLSKATKETAEFSGLADKLLSKFDNLSDVLDKVSEAINSINGAMELATKNSTKFTSGIKSSKDTFHSIEDNMTKVEYAIDRANRLSQTFNTYMKKNELASKSLNKQNEGTNLALTQVNAQLKTWGGSLSDIIKDGKINEDTQSVLLDIFDDMTEIQEDFVTTQKSSKKLWEDTLKGQVDVSAEMTKLKEITEDISDVEKILNKEYATADTKTKILLTNGFKYLEQQKALASARESELTHYSKTSAILKKNQSTVDAMSKSITSGLSKIPGGEHLSKALKVDGLADNIKKKLGDAVGSGTGKLASGILGTVGKFMAGGALLGGIIAPVVHLLSEVDAEVSKIGKEFGISRKEADKLHHKAIDLAGEMQIVGVNSEQVVASVKTLSENMGGLDISTQLAQGNKEVKQLVKDTTVLTEKFGLSGEEIKNIHTLSTLTGKSMGQLTMEATTLGKGLMTNKEAMKTLASIPKSVAVAFKGGTQELIKAAQKAKMLGMELGKVQDIGDGMLDIEQSLGKEMEARALTGKNLQLDAARMLALQGDTAGLQDEILKQAGSLEDFQKMNRIQQKAFADAMGMSVDEMTGMLTNAQKLKDIGLSSAKAEELQGKNAEELRKIMASTSDEKQKAYIEEIAKQKESASIQERFQNILKKVQEKLSALLSPILEIVHGLLDSATAGDDLNNVFSGIVDAVKFLLPPLKWILSGLIIPMVGSVGQIAKFFQGFGKGADEAGDKVQSLSSGFGGILTVLTGIAGFFVGKALLAKGMDMLKEKAADVGKTIMDKVGGSLSKVASKGTDKLGDMMGKTKTPSMPSGKAKGGPMDGIVSMFEKMDPKKMLAGAAALLIVAAALWVAAKAMQEFSTGVKWEGVLMGIVTLGALVLAVVALGTLMMSGVGAVAILAGAAALLILSGALWVMGKAMQEFSKAAVVAIPFFEMLFKNVGELIVKIGGTIATVVTSVSAGLSTIIDSFGRLLSLNPATLPLLAAGIIAVAGSLGVLAAAAGGGGIVTGIGSAVANLFGSEGPMEMVMSISQKIQPERLSATAAAIRDLADAFKYFAAETAKLADFDVDKLDVIMEKMEDIQSAQSGGIGGAITGAAKAITGFVGNIFGTSEEQKTTTVQGGSEGGSDKDKMDTVIQLLSQIAGSANQPTVIKFGDKTVEEIKSQLNFKKAYNVNIDNTYGRTT